MRQLFPHVAENFAGVGQLFPNLVNFHSKADKSFFNVKYWAKLPCKHPCFPCGKQPAPSKSQLEP
jgi:hypothetical protein